MADDAAAAGEPGAAGPAQRGFGLLVPPRGQASGPGDLPGDYRMLLEAVAAAAVEAGGPVRSRDQGGMPHVDAEHRVATIAARSAVASSPGWLESPIQRSRTAGASGACSETPTGVGGNQRIS
jgi:hypothetical protein